MEMDAFLEMQLDRAQDLYELVLMEQWDSPEAYQIHQMELREELVRVAAVTGHTVNLCPCGKVYYQDFGCICEKNWIQNEELAIEYTNSVMEMAYQHNEHDFVKKERVRWQNITNNVVDIQEWLSRH